MLLSDDLDGASQICKPLHNEVANVVGAVIALVSGTLERIYDLDEQPRDNAISDAIAGAVENAVDAGANRETIDVMNIDEAPLSYFPGNAVRISVTVAGDLNGN